MEDLQEKLNHSLKISLKTVGIWIKWTIFSILTGIFVGGIGTLFGKCMNWATATRMANPNLLFFLPLAGIAIVFLYRLVHDEGTGTNIVISAIHSNDSIPLHIAPLIFISTVITHLFGGSAGREGAALQLGGSTATGIGKLLKLEEEDQKIMIMCGMSAAFSALFGTPMSGTFFAMEVVSIGVFYYSALVPCVCSAFIGAFVAKKCNLMPESFPLSFVPEFTITNALRIIPVAIGCAIVSILFCMILHTAEQLYRRYFPNPYVRIVVGSILVIAFTLLLGTRDYNGAGIPIIERAISEGEVVPTAFLCKIILTALTLGAGFKGGEIVPSFFIGATFGCFVGPLVGLPPQLCAAVGLSSVFCGATNCPITSLLISFELFGYDAMPYYVISIALSYMFSGYYGLYHSQKILYSKYRPVYVNKKTI